MQDPVQIRHTSRNVERGPVFKCCLPHRDVQRSLEPPRTISPPPCVSPRPILARFQVLPQVLKCCLKCSPVFKCLPQVLKFCLKFSPSAASGSRPFSSAASSAQVLPQVLALFQVLPPAGLPIPRGPSHYPLAWFSPVVSRII